VIRSLAEVKVKKMLSLLSEIRIILKLFYVAQKRYV